jgi:hypothetical protein
MGRVLFTSAIGLFLVASYFGWTAPINHHNNSLSLLIGVALLVIPWFFYGREERKLRFRVGGTTEGIRTEWELDHIVSKTKKRPPEGAGEAEG